MKNLDDRGKSEAWGELIGGLVGGGRLEAVLQVAQWQAERYLFQTLTCCRPLKGKRLLDWYSREHRFRLPLALSQEWESLSAPARAQ